MPLGRSSLLRARLVALQYLHHKQPLLGSRNLLTLAIETSCDDTAVAIVEKTGSLAKLHFNERITANQGPFKGIHPILSLESHEASLANLVRSSLPHLPKSTKLEGNEGTIKVHDHNGGYAVKQLPDFIAVTRGPGMRSSLNLGVNVAKGLAVAWQIPVLGVHHMQAHALTPRLVSAMQRENSSGAGDGDEILPKFPYLSLLVSGGHTILVRSKDLVNHKIMVSTSDYAIGDCLDKIGRAVLPQDVMETSSSVSYGPLLESFAFPNGASDYEYTPPRSSREENRLANIPSAFGWCIPVPFVHTRGGTKQNALEFSFTGVESQSTRICKVGWDKNNNKFNKMPRVEPMSTEERRVLAREVMRVAFQYMASRVLQVLEREKTYGEPASGTLVLSGGVASNKFLRHVMKAYLSARGYENLDIVAPPIHLCTDNAAMIGWTGCEMWEAEHFNPFDIRTLGKWSLENLLSPEKENDARGWVHNHS